MDSGILGRFVRLLSFFVVFGLAVGCHSENSTGVECSSKKVFPGLNSGTKYAIMSPDFAGVIARL